MVFTHILIVIGVLISGTAIIWVLQQRRSPQSALAWILFIITLPYVGVPLFFALGVRKRGARYPAIAFGDDPRHEPEAVAAFDEQLRRFGLPGALSGNRLRPDADASAARASLEALVRGAETSLDVVLYRLDRDPYSNAFIAWLTEAVQRGVEVRLLLDQVGTVRRPRRHLKAFREAGGQIELFSPIARLGATGRLNLRNHRKMLIADGTRLWTGGRNVGATYLGPPSDPGTWHDLSFVIEGPVVARYGEVFEADWAKETGAPPRPVKVSAPLAENAVLQLVPSGPDLVDDGLHDALVHAIHTARRRIWIATPYFLPTDQLQHALATAARLGRDVRLLMPAKSNQRVADFARGAYVRYLEELGAKVLRHPHRMVHAKAFVIDDMAIVGSANFDIRSMLLNFETALAVYDAESVAQISDWFEARAAESLAGTRPVHLPRRLAEAVFRLGSPVL